MVVITVQTLACVTKSFVFPIFQLKLTLTFSVISSRNKMFPGKMLCGWEIFKQKNPVAISSLCLVYVLRQLGQKVFATYYFRLIK